MTQPSNTASTCKAQWKMRLLRVFAVIYLAAVCAAQDDATAPAATETTEDLTPPLPTTVYVPPEPVLTLTSARSDVFTSERVEFKCLIPSSSDWAISWMKDNLQLPNPDLSTLGEGSVLTIGSATTKDSGKYSCHVQHKTKEGVSKISNVLQISVTDPPIPTLYKQTPWSEVFVGEVTQFSCKVDSTDWTSTWYKDQNDLHREGELLQLVTVTAVDRGRYTCKAKHKSRNVYSGSSNVIDLTVNEKKPKPTLTRNVTFDEMYPGESIIFTCAVSVSTGWEYVWYHNRMEIQSPSKNTYSIPSITHSNRGEYYCRATRGQTPFFTDQSDTLTLEVSALPTPTLTQWTAQLDVFETEAVELSCNVSNPGWTFLWYKDNSKLQEEGPWFKIKSITASDKGEYYCRAHLQPRGVTSGDSSTAELTVYPNRPRPTLTRNSTFDQMYPGESIIFTCAVSVSTGWEYVWYHNGSELQSSNRNTYSIPSIAHSNSGDYYCRGKRGQTPFFTDQSDSTSLQVSDPPTPILKLLSSWSDVFPNELLEFGCDGSSPEWTFTWYKDDKELQKDSNMVLNEKGSVLNITSVSRVHQGQFACKAHLPSRGVTSGFSSTTSVRVYDSIPKPSLSMHPDFAPMYVKETVNFTCKVHVSSDWSYQWYEGERKRPYTGSTISINLDVSHKGKYSCKASRGEKTLTEHSKEINLDVQALEDVSASEQESFLFSACSVETGCCGVALVSEGRLSIHAYRWSSFRKEIPVPTLDKVTEWLDVFPTETVKLRCQMQSDGWTFTWYKDTEEVRAGDIVKTGTSGSTLSIESASASHRGRYTCSGEMKSRSVCSTHSSEVTLHVYDAKATVTLTQHPEHSLMHTEDSVSFCCHISVSSGWEYQWYKDGRPLQESKNNLSIDSVKSKDSGSYKCEVKRGKDSVFISDQSEMVTLKVDERPQASIILLTGWTEVFSTDSLVLECEVKNSPYMWNYTWFKEKIGLDLTPSKQHIVTPQGDPEQSLYSCQGIRNERPSYSGKSESLKTKNLLFKRRILLSISGCIFFGIIAVFLGCIALRVFRKPGDVEKDEEPPLFLTMAQLKDRTNAISPLTDYITDADLNVPPTEGKEDDAVCSETTLLPISSQEDQAATTDGQETTENGDAMVSFKS